MKKMKNLLTVILFVVFVTSLTVYINGKYSEYQEKKNMEGLKKRIEQIEENVEIQQNTVAQEGVKKEENTKTEETKTEQSIEKMQTTETAENTETIELEEKEILPEYATLYAENQDLYGWIKIEDTVIDYPVMYTKEDPQYYIHKGWNKEYSKPGLLFADVRTTDETENTIIYGHCMKNRTMFGSLKDYKEIDFYKEHKYIEFDTIYKKNTYEIVSVSKGIAYYENEPDDEYIYYRHTELDTEEEFEAYIQNAKNNSYYETGVTAEFGDKLITLSTCDYWTKNARLYVVAKKIS